ncbi:TIGR03758 family integrating conjugative element protein [Vibrio parahaemolyticus]|uniref:TIGR03758 family integrating conjugative element protein n=2 Tax=Vibrio parahaemolyticus TaxID=670 RepID=UPI00111D8344|nr:TIGR03758 family integrating conjugative element protein [Vibrio parahaemolyticus]EGQ8533372.1 TIGR03758 family integrating conjugative element protein [Vibrio parahaemolyticus]EJB8505133.1 TIGR03758 family integrating conjugative element protein [Vibrio parahaemolyticus]EJL3960506.1 TIGR03758 family integrating conjugative element protein [Vibrio parahaemolyticus]MBE3793553.1 TIGR03758 family integrating conjugative element protein [Vibrio parahaemolyticus]MBE3866414.1 TIGR03758 family int
MSSPEAAFEHAAGFSPHTLAIYIAGLCTVLLLMWVLWVAWSGFRGMKNKRVTKEVFRRMIFRAVFIFLVLQWFLYYGVTS